MLLSSSNNWRWFRYPYFYEGDTLEKRQAVRAFLQDRNYQIAQTTLDYEDYLWNSAYARCAEKKDSKSIAWLRSSYLEPAAAYLDGNRSMAKTVFGRDISHVLLLHLGAYSPEILPPLFDLLKARGFEVVTLEEAQRDPIYKIDPNFVNPQPGTLLEQHMDVKSLPYPPLPQKIRSARESREPRFAAPRMPREPARSADPFFDKPYEPTATAAEPAWESRAAPVSRGLSPNIKPKKKVAALFGGKVPEAAET